MTIWADEKNKKGEWKDIGIHLIACPRGSGKKSLGVVQGVVYSVKSITETSVVMEMLKAYCPNEDRPASSTKQGESYLTVGDVEEVEFEGPDGGFGAPQLVDVSKAKEEVTVPLADVPAVLRLTHAMCYYTVQGRTLRSNIVLLDTSNKNFSRRALIVGLSRATHGDHVHVATDKDAAIFLGERRRTLRAKRVITA